MLDERRNDITIGWWLPLFPGTANLIVVLVINLIRDWLRGVLDPRLERSCEPADAVDGSGRRPSQRSGVRYVTDGLRPAVGRRLHVVEVSLEVEHGRRTHRRHLHAEPGLLRAARSNDIYKLTMRAPWAGSVMGPGQPLSITRGAGPNPDWAFALDSLPGGFGFAFTTREMCEALHQEFNGYSTLLDSCESVSIKLLDAPLE